MAVVMVAPAAADGVVNVYHEEPRSLRIDRMYPYVVESSAVAS